MISPALLEQFAPHARELRQRLIRSVIAITLGATLAYLSIDRITGLCMHPLFVAYPQLQHLVYTKLTEAFISYIKLSLLIGVLLTFPYLLYQIWMFISPGLLDHERRMARQIIFWASLLFAGGVLFAFFIALPRILLFFMAYTDHDLKPMIKLGGYLTFVGRMVLTFGLAFEIPFIMVMSSRTGLVPPDHFRKKRTWFYISIVILAFILAAGDIMATTLLAVPLFGLYETGILVGRFLGTKPKMPLEQ